jgi:MATE family multidrug resistance protein
MSNNFQPNETSYLLPSGNLNTRDTSSTIKLEEFRKELFLILKRALPVIFSYILQQALPTVGLFSLGHMVNFFIFNF